MARFEPLVLCYHAVSDEWEHALAMPPAALERQLRAVALRRYRGATAEQALRGRGRLVHVTFDDAYVSVQRALPALERLRFPATVFACPGQTGQPLRIAELAGEPEHELSTLDWDGLRSLAERGVEIGSHTVSHAHLTRLADAELDRELAESRERLEAELSRPCRYLAYPYGEQDERVRAAARRAGYEAAFALRAPEVDADPFAVPRVDLYRKDGAVRAQLKTARPVRRLLFRRPGGARTRSRR